MAYTTDFFAANSYEDALALLGKKVKYPAYVFIRDTDDKTAGRLAFVEKDNTLRFVKSDAAGNISVSYDDVKNSPISNKYGNPSNPVIISELNSGMYSISGTYVIGGDLETKYVTSRKILFIVESDDLTISITKIDSNKIVYYSVDVETKQTTVSEYVTKEWVEEQGFIKESEMQKSIDEIYTKLDEQTVTKMSELENDIGYLTADEITKISDDSIAGLFYV